MHLLDTFSPYTLYNTAVKGSLLKGGPSLWQIPPKMQKRRRRRRGEIGPYGSAETAFSPRGRHHGEKKVLYKKRVRREGHKDGIRKVRCAQNDGVSLLAAGIKGVVLGELQREREQREREREREFRSARKLRSLSLSLHRVRPIAAAFADDDFRQTGIAAQLLRKGTPPTHQETYNFVKRKTRIMYSEIHAFLVRWHRESGHLTMWPVLIPLMALFLSGMRWRRSGLRFQRLISGHWKSSKSSLEAFESALCGVDDDRGRRRQNSNSRQKAVSTQSKGKAPPVSRCKCLRGGIWSENFDWSDMSTTAIPVCLKSSSANAAAIGRTNSMQRERERERAQFSCTAELSLLSLSLSLSLSLCNFPPYDSFIPATGKDTRHRSARNSLSEFHPCEVESLSLFL